MKPLQNEDFTLYLRSFHIENDSLVIETECELTNQAPKIALIMKNIKTDECWKSLSRVPENDCRFLQTPSLDFPDGAYQLFLQEQTDNEDYGHGMQSLPQFLVIADGKRQWVKEYPNQTPRAMELGEKIIFRPMRPYPQVDFCEGTTFRDDAVVLGKGLSFSVRLPKLSAPTKLTLTVKCPSLPAGTLVLLNGDTPLAEIAIKEPQELTIPVMLPSCDEQTMTLHFKFTPKRRNREIMPFPLRINLQGIRLD